MPDDGTIELISNQQQHSSALTQNNNGNDRSLTSTGVGAQEKSTPITDLLENKVAKMLGVLVCGWVLLVLVQGGMVGSLETKDCGFVTLLFFLVFFRCWRHYCPEAYRSFTDATQTLSADYLSIPNDIQQLAQQLALSSCYIRRLFYCSSLVSAMTSVVLSVMRLASQDFGKKEVENKESRDFALKVFYGLTLAEALVLLFAEALSFPIRWNSVGLADGPGDDLEVGLRTRGNSVGLADGPEDGPEDGPVNQSNECNGVAQIALPANQSNDFNSEGPADLRQRRREIPQEGALDDGHSWRKYGQKDILGAKHPRGYYRCTHRHSQGCQATKQVQRTDNNPTVFDVIYHGTHTCINKSNTHPGSNISCTTNNSNNNNKKRKTQPKWRCQVKVGSTGGVKGSLDDGHSWRKYGQKDILGAKHPRGYYRCTHRHSQGCQATKQVQRTDDNPTVFDVIYHGTHTCINKSNTHPGSNISCTTNNNDNNNKNRKTQPKWRCQVKVGSTGGVKGSLDDGHSWRKYGQKDILGAKHPRGYYRCTHRRSQGCQAIKQVQGTDDDPTVFDVIYQGIHTCIDSDLTEVVSALSETTSTTNSPMDDVNPFLTD